MSNSRDAKAWKQMFSLKSQMGRRFIEQEIHQVQQAKQSWFTLENRDNKIFQTMAITRSEKIPYTE